MRTADFDFVLPPELIAQHPVPKRDESRLLVLHRANAKIEHHKFRDLLDFLRAGDVLVLNNSRVISARLRGVNAKTGGKFEMLLLEEMPPTIGGRCSVPARMPVSERELLSKIWMENRQIFLRRLWK